MEKQSLKGDLEGSALWLQDKVQVSFYSTLFALYTVRQNYAVNGEAEKEVNALNDLLHLIGHTDDAKVTYSNGYHVNQATTMMSRISLDDHVHRPDYSNFFLATMPVMDESTLNPSEFNLLRGMFTSGSTHLKSYRRLKPYVGHMPKRDFFYLDYRLLNVDRDLRKYIATNVNSTAELASQYSHAKLKLEPMQYLTNFNNQLEIFAEQK